VLAQMSHTDMCFPIQYALTWPKRLRGSLKPLRFEELAKLEFIAPRETDFPALRLARDAGIRGGTLPAVFNAANEIAVDAFIAGRIPFPGIWHLVEKTMQAHEVQDASELEPILAADQWARGFATAKLTT
jgi:1-deoxy-D-xylulose-5-phosphate reductoisomerase